MTVKKQGRRSFNSAECSEPSVKPEDISVKALAQQQPSESSASELPAWDLRSNEPKSCEAHGLPLQVGLAEIAYGLYELDETYLADKKELFPNSNSWVLGGCISSDVDVAEVDFCPLCREAEGVWRQMKELISTASEEP
jgi:hypothetical protein